uniref:Uncharacterized protein n=1 Tax=Triticum urartu TaxID=4572 RepID=A0A8R7PSZ7_TRIUA
MVTVHSVHSAPRRVDDEEPDSKEKLMVSSLNSVLHLNSLCNNRGGLLPYRSYPYHWYWTNWTPGPPSWLFFPSCIRKSLEFTAPIGVRRFGHRGSDLGCSTVAT